MSWENIVRWYSGVYWFGHLAVLGGFVAMKLLIALKHALRPREKRADKTGAVAGAKPHKAE